MKWSTDSSFQSNIDDRKSVSGHVSMLNGGAVSWKSSKQESIADSTMEESTSPKTKQQKRLFGCANY